MKLCNLSFSVPYRYDGKSESCKQIGPKSNIIYKATLIFHVIYLLLMCTHLLFNRDKIGLRNVLTATVIIVAYATSGVSRLTFFIWEDDGLALLNGFLQFERNLLKS